MACTLWTLHVWQDGISQCVRAFSRPLPHNTLFLTLPPASFQHPEREKKKTVIWYKRICHSHAQLMDEITAWTECTVCRSYQTQTIDWNIHYSEWWQTKLYTHTQPTPAATPTDTCLESYTHTETAIIRGTQQQMVDTNTHTCTQTSQEVLTAMRSRVALTAAHRSSRLSMTRMKPSPDAATLQERSTHC